MSLTADQLLGLFTIGICVGFWLADVLRDVGPPRNKTAERDSLDPESRIRLTQRRVASPAIGDGDRPLTDASAALILPSRPGHNFHPESRRV